mmetsp:Transcript_47749/g.149670  ORF Transcript_47749/g.149670 Transcript_47749/m.149670 type:complete len:304 (+) Transcript_47749:292-1203(+)
MFGSMLDPGQLSVLLPHSWVTPPKTTWRSPSSAKTNQLQSSGENSSRVTEKFEECLEQCALQSIFEEIDYENCELQPIPDDDMEPLSSQVNTEVKNSRLFDSLDPEVVSQIRFAANSIFSKEKMEDVEVMYVFKLRMCPDPSPHDWTQCRYTHEGEIAKRRNPATHSANPCAEYEKNMRCSRGEKCLFAHGVWERGLHPQRYRTTLCSKGKACNRMICFFAHSEDQLRKPTGEVIDGSTLKCSRRKMRAMQRKAMDQFLSFDPRVVEYILCHFPEEEVHDKLVECGSPGSSGTVDEERDGWQG